MRNQSSSIHLAPSSTSSTSTTTSLGPTMSDMVGLTELPCVPFPPVCVEFVFVIQNTFEEEIQS